MENCDITIKEEPIFEDDCFFTIREVSADEELLEEPITAPVLLYVPDVKQSVKCKICNKGFFPQELAIHSATAHLTSTQCLKCKERFPSNWYLSRHSAICMSDQQLDADSNMECKGCGKKFISIWDLKMHSAACKYKPTKKGYGKKKESLPVKESSLKERTNPRKKGRCFVCPVCDIAFTHRVLLAQHSVLHPLKTKSSEDSFDETLLNVVRKK